MEIENTAPTGEFEQENREISNEKPKEKRVFRKIILLILILIALLFIFQPVQTKGNFATTAFDESQILLTENISYLFAEPKIGDIVVFKNPDNYLVMLGVIIGIPSGDLKSYKVISGKHAPAKDVERNNINRRVLFKSITESEINRLKEIQRVYEKNIEKEKQKIEVEKERSTAEEQPEIKPTYDEAVIIDKDTRKVTNTRHNYTFIYPSNWTCPQPPNIEYMRDKVNFDNEGGVGAPLAISSQGVYGSLMVSPYSYEQASFFDAEISSFTYEYDFTVYKLGTVQSGDLLFIKYEIRPPEDFQGGHGPNLYYITKTGDGRVFEFMFLALKQEALDNNLQDIENTVKSLDIF